MLITGDKGYIGTHLRQLFPDAEGCDRKDDNLYQDIVGREFDVVVHLAALVSVEESLQAPTKYLYNNAFDLITFLTRNRVKRLVFASSAGVYGSCHNADECDGHWLFCINPYTQSKFIAEAVIRNLCPNHAILRLANVFGGTGRGEAAVHPHFEKDDPIIVYGGEQTRDFVPVDIVCKAMAAAALGTMEGTFNIGTGVETSISDLALQFARSRGVQIKVEPKRGGDVDYNSLDCTKAKTAGLLVT